LPNIIDFLPALINSLSLAASAAILTLLMGLFLAVGLRFKPSPFASKVIQLATTGYAIPGTVLGLGVLICLTFADSLLADLSIFVLPNLNIFLTGTVFGLLAAYCVRFMSISYSSVEAGLARIPQQMDAAAQSLGANKTKRFLRIYLPLLRPSLFGILILVFVDTMKELPATLILRPFNFETLATQIYGKASLGLIEEAAVPALLIITTGILPVILAAKLMIPGSHNPDPLKQNL